MTEAGAEHQSRGSAGWGFTAQQSFPISGKLILHIPVFHTLSSVSRQDGPEDDDAQVSVQGDFPMAESKALSTLTSLSLLLIQNKEKPAQPGKAIVKWV